MIWIQGKGYFSRSVGAAGQVTFTAWGARRMRAGRLKARPPSPSGLTSASAAGAGRSSSTQAPAWMACPGRSRAASLSRRPSMAVARASRGSTADPTPCSARSRKCSPATLGWSRRMSASGPEPTT
jgi:hypothetical protein